MSTLPSFLLPRHALHLLAGVYCKCTAHTHVGTQNTQAQIHTHTHTHIHAWTALPVHPGSGQGWVKINSNQLLSARISAMLKKGTDG